MLYEWTERKSPREIETLERSKITHSIKIPSFSSKSFWLCKHWLVGKGNEISIGELAIHSSVEKAKNEDRLLNSVT